MILKASQREGGKQLAAHLLNTRDNDHVTVHSVRGFVSDHLKDAFNEAYAISRGTKCKQYLFSVSFSPPMEEDVSDATFMTAVEEVEKRNKLVGHPRAVVFHEKDGRRHAHCVWSRIDTKSMTAVNLSHFKIKLRDLSRELYLDNGWQLPRGLMSSEATDPLNFDLAEWQQALRAKADPKKLKAMFAECLAASGNRQAFDALLKERGFILAKGDRRGFVTVDWRGEVYSLSRWTGKKSKELSAKLGSRAGLCTVESAMAEASQMFKRRNRQLQTKLTNEISWLKAEYELARKNLIQRHREERRELKTKQAKEMQAFRRANQAKVPTGLKALWFRLTRQYNCIIEENRNAHIILVKLHGQRYQKLVSNQLQKRRSQETEIQRKLTHFETLLKYMRGHTKEIGFPSLNKNIVRIR